MAVFNYLHGYFITCIFQRKEPRCSAENKCSQQITGFQRPTRCSVQASLLCYFSVIWFFPTYFSRSCSAATHSPQGRCALPVGEEGPGHVAARWFEARAALRCFCYLSHLPHSRLDCTFFYFFPIPLLSRKFTELVFHLLPEIGLVNGNKPKDAGAYQHLFPYTSAEAEVTCNTIEEEFSVVYVSGSFVH